jgi:DNA-binding NarL/FixJ family response regulator
VADKETAVRVVVGDADTKVRTATTRLLQRVGFDVLEAETGTDALELARTEQPSAVVLDVALPDISGYQVCHILRREFGPTLPILLLSDHLEPHDRAAGLLLGADDYVAKPLLADDLLARVSRTNGADKAANDLMQLLTASEQRVLRMLATGIPPKVIAERLSIAPKTASMHIQNAMQKLGVHSRTEAVALAHRSGLADA